MMFTVVQVINGVTVTVVAEGGSAGVVGVADSESSMTLAHTPYVYAFRHLQQLHRLTSPFTGHLLCDVM